MARTEGDKNFDVSKLYEPLPQQTAFHKSSAKYRLLGGAAGGGKTIAIIWEAILRCLYYDFPVNGAIFRRSFPELDSTIVREMRNVLPTWFYRYNQQKHVLTIKPTGDVIDFCYAESDNDVVRYQSREWDFIGIDELTHFSEYQFTYLLSRLRTTKSLKTKFFAATNPGNRGHVWVKNRWVTKDCAALGYEPEDYFFVPAGVRDNPYLMKANPDYINNLMNLPDKERRALLEGDWDVFEGQFFDMWDTTRHVVKSFDVPESWKLVMGWDDGTRAPRAVYVFAIDNDGRVWVIWEYYKKGETIGEAAGEIRDKLEALGLWNRIFKCVVDPSMSRQSVQTGLSSIDVLEGMGFGFNVGEIESANNDRQEGWRVMRNYLGHRPFEEPMLKIFDSCIELIRTLPQMIYYDSKTGEGKKDDLDSSMEDHAVDAVRYTLMSMDRLPGRFQYGKNMPIVKRNYVPRSTLSSR